MEESLDEALAPTLGLLSFEHQGFAEGHESLNALRIPGLILPQTRIWLAGS
jgi:hypothetical protein